MKNRKFLIFLAFSLIIVFLYFYFRTLVLLPVFADEAIYLRWAQLIIIDWKRYLFFPMNDGKTPLLIWLVVPFLKFFNDPLLAGRLLSSLFFFGQVFLIFKISFKLTKDKFFAILSALFFAISPMFFWHGRLFLLDNGLNFFLLLTWFLSLSFIDNKFHKLSKIRIFSYCFLVGLSFYLALLSKISAITFLPVIFFNFFLVKKLNWSKFWQIFFYNSFSIFISFFLFALLKFSPSFSQLFSRGGDFLIDLKTISFNVLFENFIKNAKYFFEIFRDYFSFLIILFLASLLYLHRWAFRSIKDLKKLFQLKNYLFFNFLFLILPLMFLGKIIYPRYLILPAIFYFLLSLYTLYILLRFSQSHLSKIVFLVIVALPYLLINFLFIKNSFSGNFFEIMNLPEKDREQYLITWSAGGGINQAVQLIKQESQNQKILVLTEGFVGTLPDGLTIYFFKENKNVIVEGIGLIDKIEQKWIEKAQEFDKVFYVVNKNRLEIDLKDSQLKKEICRSQENNECLQIYEITKILKK